MTLKDEIGTLHITTWEDLPKKDDAPRSEAATSEERIEEKENVGEHVSDSSITQKNDKSQEDFAKAAEKAAYMIYILLKVAAETQENLQEMQIRLYNPFAVSMNEHVKDQVMLSCGIGTLASLLGAELFRPYSYGRPKEDALAFIYQDVLFYQYGREKGINEYEFD